MSVKGHIWKLFGKPYYDVAIFSNFERIYRKIEADDGTEFKLIKKKYFHFPIHRTNEDMGDIKDDEESIYDEKNKRWIKKATKVTEEELRTNVIWFLKKGRRKIVNFDVTSTEPMEYVIDKKKEKAFNPITYRRQTTHPDILKVLLTEKNAKDINAPPEDKNKDIIIIALAIIGVIAALYIITSIG